MTHINKTGWLIPLAICAGCSLGPYEWPGHRKNPFGIRTVETENGYLYIRGLYRDSTIVGDSIRIEGVVYDVTMRDTSHDGHVILDKKKGGPHLSRPMKSANARYRYHLTAEAHWLVFGNFAGYPETRPRIDSLVLPPKSVLQVDTYMEYDPEE
jgi:hypothetical protein